MGHYLGMPNPAIHVGRPDLEPCTSCEHCGDSGKDERGKTFIECPKLGRFFGWETGCRYWTRAVGLDEAPRTSGST